MALHRMGRGQARTRAVRSRQRSEGADKSRRYSGAGRDHRGIVGAITRRDQIDLSTERTAAGTHAGHMAAAIVGEVTHSAREDTKPRNAEARLREMLCAFAISARDLTPLFRR